MEKESRQSDTVLKLVQCTIKSIHDLLFDRKTYNWIYGNQTFFGLAVLLYTEKMSEIRFENNCFSGPHRG